VLGKPTDENAIKRLREKRRSVDSEVLIPINKSARGHVEEILKHRTCERRRSPPHNANRRASNLCLRRQPVGSLRAASGLTNWRI
jgi:hypothetical protein